MHEGVSAVDRLDIRVTPAPRVICVSCKRHIYYVKEQRDGSHEFAPTERQRTVRPDLVCPVCGNNLAAYAAGQPMIRTDRGWV